MPSLRHPSEKPANDSPPTIHASVWLGFATLLLAVLVVVAQRPALRHGVPLAVLVTLGFGLSAWVVRGVTLGGALAGFLSTSLLFVAGGPALFGAVLLVFVLTLAATRFGRQRKQQLAIAERSSGRDGAQVLANVGLSALAAGLSVLTPIRLPLLAGSLAALAEAACDTVSSETGKALAQTARLVTSGKTVPAGTDGAISLPGTLTGAAAATLVGMEALLSGLVSARLAIVVVLSGILGMLMDSLLGVTLERRGWLTNNGVNFASTGFSVLLATIATQQFA